MFLNMKLLAQHTLNGFGGMGEGMSMQLARDGRRVLWLAHESAPKNFTAVDVTDPRAPKVIVQTDLPHAQMRSNSLEVAGDLMAVAYQVTKFGLKPAGFELFDISVPEKPKSISFFDASGPHSRGCHQLWFVDGKTVHMACADPELKPRNPKDDQVYRIVDVANPSKPVAVGRWHLPGTMEGDDAPPPQRLPAKFDAGFRAHNTNVYPERPDRCYLGYIDGGIMVLDITDRARPKMISRWTNSPPYNGFNHTVLPLFGRGLLVVSDESRARTTASTGRSSSGCSTRATSATWSASPRCRRRRWTPSRRAAGASARTTCTRTRRCPAPGARRTSCSAPSSTPACAPTT